MGKFKRMMEVTSIVSGYSADEGEPDTGFIRGDKKRLTWDTPPIFSHLLIS